MNTKDIADQVTRASIAEGTRIGRDLPQDQADAVIREMESRIKALTKQAQS